MNKLCTKKNMNIRLFVSHPFFFVVTNVYDVIKLHDNGGK